MTLKLLDLFCGAGGLSLGFERYGEAHNINIEPVLALDMNAQAIETYNANRPEHPVGRVGDIKELTHIEERVDLVLGGPPCQGFSTANRQRLIDDPRNSLYKEFIRVVELCQPTAVLMENVVGIKAREGEIIKDYERIGYHAASVLVNASQFGLPQNRRRVFFFASKHPKLTLNFKSLESSRVKETFVLGDALRGLRPLKAKREKNNTSLESDDVGYLVDHYPVSVDQRYSDFINGPGRYPRDQEGNTLTYNHISRYNNDRDIEIFSRLPQGADSSHESIADIMPYKSRAHIFKDKYYKLDETKVCKAITAHMKFDCNMYIHPTQARGLTPREAARVQTFPDDYVFKGAYTKWYQQIGNAVPPRLAYALAEEIFSYRELWGALTRDP